MSDYLNNLAARNFDLPEVVQPRPVSLFESSAVAGPSPAVHDFDSEAVSDESTLDETASEAVSPPRAPAERPLARPPQGFSSPSRDPDAGDRRDDQSAVPDRPIEGPKGISPGLSVPQQTVTGPEPPPERPEPSGARPPPLPAPEPPMPTRVAVEPAVRPAQPRPAPPTDARESDPAPAPPTPAAWGRPLPQDTAPGPSPGSPDRPPTKDDREPNAAPPRLVPEESHLPMLESVVREISIEGATSPIAPEPTSVVARPQATLLERVEPGPPLAEPPPPPEPTIQVTIGRLEVRATPPTPAPKKRRPQPPVMSLDEYLRQRAEGDRK